MDWNIGNISPLASLLLLWTAMGMNGPRSSIASPQPDPGKSADTSVTILYDNNRFDRRLKTGWGFSCLVQGCEKTVLFDTGGDGDALLGNMRLLGVKPSQVDLVVLSHIHGDHTGGLGAFLEKNPGVVVYLPSSFPADFRRAVMAMGACVEEVSEAKEISPRIYSTGVLGDGIREQALALKTTDGLVVVTGCAHPGIVNMVRKAREIAGEDRVYLVLGGFHLGGESPSRIESIAEELRGLSVRKIAPCHCSGDGTRRVFKQGYGADYVESGVGTIIKLPR